MIRKCLQYLIRRGKNAEFSFDDSLSSLVIFLFAIDKAIALLRSVRVAFIPERSVLLFVGKGVTFRYAHNMRFGRNVVIGDYARLVALGRGRLTLGNNVSVGAHSQVVISTSFGDIGEHITIGDNVGFGEFAYIGGAGGVSIGAETIIGQYFSVHPENHIFEASGEAIRKQGVSRKGITIGRNCWIGSKVTVVDGASIGDNCVVAAGAVVTGSFPKNKMIGGVPAKVLRNIE